MARIKQRTPIQREPSDFAPHVQQDEGKRVANGHADGHNKGASTQPRTQQSESGALQLIICVGGIYASLCVPSLSLQQSRN